MVSFWCLYGFIKRVMTEIPPTYSPGSSGERDSNILTWTRKKGSGFIRFIWILAEYISRQLSDKSDKSASIFYKPQILGISQMQITSASEIIPLICAICVRKTVALATSDKSVSFFSSNSRYLPFSNVGNSIFFAGV